MSAARLLVPGGAAGVSANGNGSHVEKLLLTPEEVAETLAISRTRVYDLIRRGELWSVKIGKVRRVPVVALRAYVEQLEAEAPAR